jgi:hypothetical protein
MASELRGTARARKGVRVSTGVPRQAVLAACGVAGPLVFLACMAAATLTQDDYSSRREYISALGARTADARWIMAVGFTALGALAVPFAAGLRKGIPGRPLAGPVLLAGAGAGLALIGIVPNDCSDALAACEAQLREHTSWQNVFHDTASAPAFFCLVAAPIALARPMARDPRWRGFALFSLITSAVVAVVMIVDGLEVAAEWGYGGLVQRVHAGLLLLWAEAVAWRLLTLSFGGNEASRAA